MKGLKDLIIIELKTINRMLKILKHLVYDMIPEIYDVKWYKKDFEYKLDYYFLKPVIYLVMFVVSLLDTYAMVYRIVYLVGAMEGVFKCQNKQVKSKSGVL